MNGSLIPAPGDRLPFNKAFTAPHRRSGRQLLSDSFAIFFY
jgi:hypothetical protein